MNAHTEAKSIPVKMYITAIYVIMVAVSALLSEFGFVSLATRLLQPLLKPVYGLPGVVSPGIITTFLSDNHEILALAEDQYFRHFFKAYQFPALTNLRTSFGIGLLYVPKCIASLQSGEGLWGWP